MGVQSRQGASPPAVHRSSLSPRDTPQPAGEAGVVDRMEKQTASDDDDPADKPSRKARSEFVAGACYCTMSISMVLLNKVSLSSFHFECPNCLLFFQCALCCVLVKAAAMLGYINPERLSWRVAKVWLPVNVIFVSMIWSSFYSLKHLNVAMVTVLKNLTNLITIVGDYAVNGRTYPIGVWFTLLLMFISAVAGGSTDLTFSAVGYLWQLGNCVATASYSLYLRGVMDRVQTLSTRRGGFDEFSMVWYNNLLSLPFVGILVIVFGEHKTLWQQEALRNNYFLLAALGSGLVGFAISFCSLWFLSTTTATTYSLTGSLNKIPLAIIGLVSFGAKPSVENTISILIGLLAGVVFGYVKSQKPKPKAAPVDKMQISGSLNNLVVTEPRPGKW